MARMRKRDYVTGELTECLDLALLGHHRLESAGIGEGKQALQTLSGVCQWLDALRHSTQPAIASKRFSSKRIDEEIRLLMGACCDVEESLSEISHLEPAGQTYTCVNVMVRQLEGLRANLQ